MEDRCIYYDNWTFLVGKMLRFFFLPISGLPCTGQLTKAMWQQWNVL